MPVKSIILSLLTSKLIIPLIFAVSTPPSIRLSYPKVINACSKLASGIAVVCAVDIKEIAISGNSSSFFMM